ncbi:MAG TPA: sigma-54 dependent transcriptional regulator [Blastocatellia bacterium]|nr:sigma-54 dependent transcriptional regulator [Blastocatellia bacterium]
MKLLIIDDEESVRNLIRQALLDHGYEIYTAANGKEALALTSQYQFDLIFCDVVMEGMNGFEVLTALRGRLNSEAEVILMTGQASIEAAINAIQNGANDYICKPFSIGVLQGIASAVRERRSPSNLVKVKAQASQNGLIGSSPIMIQVVKEATRVASTDLPVMICGESGTGKELIAKLIHQKSPRAHMPFVTLNCGALPDTLLESELFGYTRGAFTGADNTRRGLFEEAHGGTLLLDEITETSPAFQVKLLRTLQEGEIRQLGSNVKKKVDVRIISATNRDPKALSESGSFRQDLLYRLQGIAINLPPLRERKGDIRGMALAFLSHHSPAGREVSISNDALLALDRYDWPGNVRELRHLMQRLAAMNTGLIQLEDLPSEIFSASSAEAVLDEIVREGELPTLGELESRYLLQVLRAVNGNKSKAAQVLGVDRKTLYRMIERRQ